MKDLTSSAWIKVKGVLFLLLGIAAAALKWLIAAARKRHALSEAYLGDLYWDGKLVQRDRTRALMWYILAQQSTKPSEHPSIFERYNELISAARQDERLEAEARARVWADQYPADGNSSAE